MFELIGSVFSLAFGVVKLIFGLIGGALQFVFGLLGGIFSFLLALGGSLLVGGLVLLAIVRRKSANKSHADDDCADRSTRAYDVDDEEFTSFYDQFRESSTSSRD